jgi:DNA-binding NtrC family response regulator
MATILVVDDEQSIRDSLSALLSTVGDSRVETAGTAREATEIAARQPPDLLIVDWMLGDQIDGLQLAETLRQTHPRMEIIVVTGYLSDQLQRRIETMSHIRAFSKPCPHDEFMQAIDDALSRCDRVTE